MSAAVTTVTGEKVVVTTGSTPAGKAPVAPCPAGRATTGLGETTSIWSRRISSARAAPAPTSAATSDAPATDPLGPRRGASDADLDMPTFENVITFHRAGVRRGK